VGRGVARAALEGALDQIAEQGGGLVEAISEVTAGREAQGRFLFSARVELFEDLGFAWPPWAGARPGPYVGQALLDRLASDLPLAVGHPIGGRIFGERPSRRTNAIVTTTGREPAGSASPAATRPWRP